MVRETDSPVEAKLSISKARRVVRLDHRAYGPSTACDVSDVGHVADSIARSRSRTELHTVLNC